MAEAYQELYMKCLGEKRLTRYSSAEQIPDDFAVAKALDPHSSVDRCP